MAGCFLVLGNLWLVVALTLELGKHIARTQPTMYSFLPWGKWYYPGTYNSWIALCVLMAAVHFALSYLSHRRRA